MPVEAAVLGSAIELVTDISKRWVLAYSAGIGYLDNLSLDDRRPDLRVPMTFCSVLEWALHGRSRSAQLGLLECEQRTGVHALQSTVSHNPFRAGERVLVRSTIRYLRSTSSGVYVESDVECSNFASREPYTTSLYGAIFRGVQGPDAAVGTAGSPLGASMGDVLSEVSIEITPGFSHVYSECAQIWNPIHTEFVAAQEAGLGEPIVHGSATWALAGREIVRRYLDGDAARLIGLSGRFRKPVFAGSSIRLRVYCPQDGKLPFEVINHQGEIAIESGCAMLS